MGPHRWGRHAGWPGVAALALIPRLGIIVASGFDGRSPEPFEYEVLARNLLAGRGLLFSDTIRKSDHPASSPVLPIRSRRATPPPLGCCGTPSELPVTGLPARLHRLLSSVSSVPSRAGGTDGAASCWSAIHGSGVVGSSPDTAKALAVSKDKKGTPE